MAIEITVVESKPADLIQKVDAGIQYGSLVIDGKEIARAVRNAQGLIHLELMSVANPAASGIAATDGRIEVVSV